MTDDPETAWVEIRRCAARAEAERYALVLVAMGIECRLVPREGRVLLLVAPPDAARARRELGEYIRENSRRRPPSLPARPLHEGIDSVLVYASILVFLHVASIRQAFSLEWSAAGAAQAGSILSGEWWRTVTALGLHADFGHLAGNVVFGGLFALFVVQYLGVGLAWLAILLAGSVGNVLSALTHSAGHTAIGASTAVFAALGIFVALSWRHQTLFRPYGIRRWLPLAAGVMLLAYLGFDGERTDIVAHVTGFAAGVAFGAVIAHAEHRIPQGPGAQRAFGAGALALFAFAWLVALRAHG